MRMFAVVILVLSLGLAAWHLAEYASADGSNLGSNVAERVEFGLFVDIPLWATAAVAAIVWWRPPSLWRARAATIAVLIVGLLVGAAYPLTVAAASG